MEYHHSPIVTCVSIPLNYHLRYITPQLTPGVFEVRRLLKRCQLWSVRRRPASFQPPHQIALSFLHQTLSSGLRNLATGTLLQL